MMSSETYAPTAPVPRQGPLCGVLFFVADKTKARAVSFETDISRIPIVAGCPLGSFHTGLQVRTFRRLSRRLPAAPESLVKLYDTVEFV